MFSEQDRQLFVYHDGEKEVHADPLDIRRKLLQASVGAFYRWLSHARDVEAPLGPDGKEVEEEPMVVLGRLDAQDKVLAAARHAFGLAPLDPATGKGCTEAMVRRVLHAWATLMEGEKTPDAS